MDLHRRLGRYFTHSDARGSIEGLINTGTWREVNLIRSEAGVVRGRHYHKHAEECFIILSGRIKVDLRLPASGAADRSETLNVQAGDVFIVPPLVEHTFDILEDAVWINLMSIPMDANAPDFHKYT
jgi:mannose-6-phosphate isomerase-like protein (cupin superfamily)